MRLKTTALLSACLFALAAPALAQAPAFTADTLARLDRASDPQLSPDGKTLAYVVRSTDWENDRGVTAVWLAPLDGSAPAVRAAWSDGGAASPRWSPDGRSIWFTSARSGSNQMWRVNADGTGLTQVTALPLDVGAFRVSPDGRRLVVGVTVLPDCPDLACTKARQAEAATAKVRIARYERLPLRPWDRWNDGTRNQLVALALNEAGVAEGEPVFLMRGFDGDAPARQTGDDGDFAFTPDGRSLVFAANAEGRTEAMSTNVDLWRVPLDGSARPENVTPDNPGADLDPSFSPDGKTLLWRASKKPNGSDRFAVRLRDLATGRERELGQGWDRSADEAAWSADGRSIYVAAQDSGRTELFALKVADPKAEPSYVAQGNIGGFDASGGRLAFLRDSWTSPAQVFAARADGAAVRQVSALNPQIRPEQLGQVQKFAFAGWNGEGVAGWIVKPAGWTEGKKYPVLYWIHGGPKSSWLDSWSYRWNPQVYAAQGYAVVMVDFHGSTGYGHAFMDAITGHWGDRPLEDLQKGWAAALRLAPWLDGERACAMGASYGGYMVNLIAGKWKEPWRCLVNHAGVFDPAQLMYGMDIGWFSSEFGGYPFEKADLYREFSPSTYVQNWSVPMLVLHGARDFRVPPDHGIQTFAALQFKGVPSAYVHIPDENHWVLKPQNSVRWHGEMLGWVDRWLK